MKKQYVTPSLDELSLKAEEILLSSQELSATDEATGKDLDWSWGI